MFRAHFSRGPKPYYVITEMQPERTTQADTYLNVHQDADRALVLLLELADELGGGS